MLPNLKLISPLTMRVTVSIPSKETQQKCCECYISRASKDVSDKEINLLTPDAQKQGQSGKESSAANDLAIFE